MPLRAGTWRQEQRVRGGKIQRRRVRVRRHDGADRTDPAGRERGIELAGFAPVDGLSRPRISRIVVVLPAPLRILRRLTRETDNRATR
jgi:hypothetical protein